MASNRKFNVAINLLNQASDPAEADEGDIYYNTTDDRIRVYKNSTWVNLAYSDDVGIVSTDYITFDTTPEATIPATQGTLSWDSGESGINLTANSNVDLHLGQQNIVLVKNATGASIPKGSVVYINGAAGQRPTIALSDADTEATSSKTLGLTAETIADAAEGFVTTFGVQRGVNTLGMTEGASVWLSSTAGAFTTTIPAEPAHSVFIGYVVKASASAGEIFVNPQNGYELNELHGVTVDTTPADNEVLAFDSSSGLWINQTPAEARLAGLDIANAFTVGGHTITNAATGTIPLQITGISGQTVNNFESVDNGGLRNFTVGMNGQVAIRSNSTTYSASLNVNTGTATTIGTVIRGAASQTADLLQAQISDGTVKLRVNASGQLVTAEPSFFNTTSSFTASLNVQPAATSWAGLVIRGLASQTGDLLQLQASDGTVYAKFSPFGQLAIGSNPTIYNNARISLNTVATTAVGMVIRGVASQTANLFELQSSAANNLAFFTAAGLLDLSAVSATAPNVVGGVVGDKIALYEDLTNAGYGFGIQNSRIVAYTNASTDAFSVRPKSGTGHKSSGTDAVTLYANGGYASTLTASNQIAFYSKLAASHSVNAITIQNNASTTIFGVDANGNTSIGSTLTFANPGVGNETKFVFTKQSDSAQLRVVERATDQTFYEFYMADNPTGSDYFQWTMANYESGSLGWMPLQMGGFTTRHVAQSHVFWGNLLSTVNTPFYTTNNVTSTAAGTEKEVVKYAPYNSTTYNLQLDLGTGTGTLNVDINGYTGSVQQRYWVTMDSSTTFKWGYNFYQGTATATGVTITGGWQLLADGIYVKLSGTGYVTGDTWSWAAYPVSKLSLGGTPLTSTLASFQPAAGMSGIQIKMASSPTQDPFAVQNSAGTKVFRIDTDGDIFATSIVKSGGTSGQFLKADGSVDSNTYLTSASSLTAGNLTGTIPSAVLGNSTHYVGTTAIALNRSSAAQVLTGITSIDGYLTLTNTGKTGTVAFITPGANSQATWANYPVGLGTMVNSNQSANGTPTSNYQYFHKVANRDFAGGWGGLSIDFATGDLYTGLAADNTVYATWYKMAKSDSPSFTGSITLDSVLNVDTFSASSSPLTDTAFAASSYSSAEYTVYVKNASGRYVSKILLVCDGTNDPQITEYGIVTVGTAPTVTVATSGTAANPSITVTSASATQIRLVRTVIAA